MEIPAQAAITEKGRRWRLLWIVPRLTFLLFVGGVGLLIWNSERADKEERRATLISDVLWLEQNLRFHLVRNEELLGRLDSRHIAGPAPFEAFARTLFGFESGLRQLMWLDPAGRVRQAHPSVMDPALSSEGFEGTPSLQSFRLATSLGKPVYSAPYPVFSNDWQFEVHVPVSREGHVIGVAVGIYRIRDLLSDSVPWWLAERYRISILADGGKLLGARSKVESQVTDEGYQVAFDPPGWGLTIQAVPYHAQRPLASVALSIALVVLAIAVLWSLWILRRHALRRQAAEEGLRREHSFRKAMEDALDTGMRARNLEGEIIYVNPAFCRMVGWEAKELIGRRPPMPYWADEHIDETRALHDRVLAGNAPSEGFELKFRRRDGQRIDVLIHETPLLDANGRPMGWMGSIVDITERKRSEDLARQQQERLQATARLVAVGEVASSIAHELNQPLAAISSYCTGAANLLRSNGDRDEVLPALEKAVDQSRRAAQVIRRIYSLARPSDSRTEKVDLGAKIESALELLEAEMRQKSVKPVFAELASASIDGDPVLIEQVLINLLRNAMDAMQECPPDRRSIEITLDTSEGYAVLTVADHGTGIDPAVADKLFDPLFSTKPDGMGMGLAICRSVVENHRGRLTFEPNPEGGTVFKLMLPLSST